MKHSYITATDQFCGAGGTTTGAKAAGIEVKMALNHWSLAIETHNTNHPETDHDCTDIQACNPRRYPSTTMLFTSPECTNHSLAKGRKRKISQTLNLFGNPESQAAEERSRATMWDVPRFAEYHQYETVVVENVVDARYWVMWDAWLMAMHSLGYRHKCLYLNSMFFHPCPQSRDRLYVVFWKKGNRAPDLEFKPLAPCPHCQKEVYTYQNWKRSDKKWGKYGTQYVYRCSDCYEIIQPYFYCALNVIDWSVPITRIGNRKKSLAEKTLKRIQFGLEKYGKQRLIISNGQHSSFAVQIHSDAYQNKVKPAQEALFTATTRQEQNLLLMPPAIINLRNHSKVKSSLDPLNTFTTGGINHALLIQKNFSDQGASADSPSNCLLSARALQSFLSYYYGNGHQCTNMSDPIRTIRTVDNVALVQPDIKVDDCYYRVLKAHEVQRAMAFEDSYVVKGNSRQRVKQLGNAVTPPVMEWIAGRCVDALG